MGSIGRRQVLLAATAMLAAGHPRAQSPARVPRVALLLPNDLWTEAPFRDALRDLGYREGGNLVVERRSANGALPRLPELAAELVRRNPDVLVPFLTQASIAAKQATSTIPIVMVGTGDPIGAGLVPSLARPGGNVTGTSGQNAAVVGKQLELVREIIPAARRVGVLWNPANPVFQAQAVSEARAAAKSLGMQLDLLEASTQDELDRRLQALGSARPDVLLVVGDPVLIAHARRIAQRLLALRLPAVGGRAPTRTPACWPCTHPTSPSRRGVRRTSWTEYFAGRDPATFQSR